MAPVVLALVSTVLAIALGLVSNWIKPPARMSGRVIAGVFALVALALLGVAALGQRHGQTGDPNAAGGGSTTATVPNPSAPSGQQSSTSSQPSTGSSAGGGGTANPTMPNNNNQKTLPGRSDPPVPPITTAAPNPPAPADPWQPPSGTPEWTMHHTDAVDFDDPPQFHQAPPWGDLTFQADIHQINWYHWTDSPDLSLNGCRNSQVDHWDGIKLDLFDTPRVYCRVDPENARRIEYVQFTAKDTNASTPFVRIKAWVITT